MEIFFIYPCLFLIAAANTTYYNTLYQFKLTSDEVDQFKANGTFENCTTLVVDCDETEYRRINGTCNNLDYPAAGAARTPLDRLLTPEFNLTAPGVYDPRLSVSGEALPPCREVREASLADGTVPDTSLTSLVPHLLVGFATDSATTMDTKNYLSWRPYCCADAGKSDPMCYPLSVSEKDRVHRFNNIRCLNMTRPQTFATSGCCPNTTIPSRIVPATPLLDLSHIYGSVEDGRRSYKGGNLSSIFINGREFPDTTHSSQILGINFVHILIKSRMHNLIATKLAAVNPDWDDKKLFWTAREINIAYSNQIFFHELWPLLLGRDRMIEDGVITDSDDFRDIYDSTRKPSTYVEYMMAMRTLHTLQDGAIRMFDVEGNYMKSFPATNLTANIDYNMKEGDNIVYMFQSFIRQPAAGTKDAICDPDMTNKGLGQLQISTDILANDLCKSRLAGMPSFTTVRNFCFGDNITCMDDLKGIITAEGIEIFKALYKSVLDIDWMAGAWLEIPYPDAYVSPTVYCFIKAQLYHYIASDRFFFDRPRTYNAFTDEQLAEIRKLKIARIICDVGDSVTKIQPNAFEVISDSNPLTDCNDIPNIDYTVWKDDSCDAESSST